MEIERSQSTQANNIDDFIRLVVSGSGSRGGHIYLGQRDGKNFFYVSQVIPSWYNLRGLPMVFYCEHDEYPEESFVIYRKPTDSESERWEFANTIPTNPSTNVLPIIKVKEIPEFLF